MTRVISESGSAATCEIHVVAMTLPANTALSADTVTLAPAASVAGTFQVEYVLVPPVSPTLRARFQQLASEWRRDTGHLSMMEQREAHPAYAEIIAMGLAVVPLLLEAVAARQDLWYGALATITGENPASPADAGRIDRLAAAWLAWGNQHGYLAA